MKTTRHTIIVLFFFAAAQYGWAQCKFEANLTGVDVKCNGDFTGEATVNIDPVGGYSGPYTFRWFDGDTRQTRKDLPAGTHFVKITDANGCFLNEFITLEEPEPLMLEYAKQDALCFNDPSGIINLSITGGVSPYNHQWSNGETTEDVNLLLAGTYQVNVTDANFCNSTKEVVIDEPEPLEISPSVIATSCPESADGIIKTVVFGGVLSYSYQWSNGKSIPNITNLATGNYTLNVTDGNGCILTKTYTVPKPPPIEIEFETDAVSCYQESDGSIHAFVTGGTPGYKYQWSNSVFVLGDTTVNPKNLPSDNYTLRVTDLNSCVKVADVVLTEPQPLVLNLNSTPASCFKKLDGSVNLSVSGGTTPYSYLWSNGARTQDVDQLLAGEYSVVVADQTGCGQLGKISVGQPDSLDFQADVVEVSCKDQDNGQIIIDPIGGTEPYDADWNTGSSEFAIADLQGNTSYTVQLTDANECVYTGVFEITINPRDCVAPIGIPTAFTPNGDGVNDLWLIENYEVYLKFHVEVFSKWGSKVFESDGYEKPWNGSNNNNELPASTYYYIINLGNGDPIVSGYVVIVR